MKKRKTKHAGGRPVTVGADHRLSMRLPSDLILRANRDATTRGIPLSQAIREALATAYPAQA